MDWLATLKSVAPTVASAMFGPLGAVAVASVGELLGLSDATKDKISEIIQTGQITPEQIGKLRELELEYQNNEKERGFRYAELSFKDRDSARQASVSGGTQKMLFWLSLVLLILTIGTEIAVLFYGYPDKTPEIIVGRVLGLMDAVAMLVLSYWYGTTNGSAVKNELLSQNIKVG
jgi:hypothetical protein